MSWVETELLDFHAQPSAGVIHSFVFEKGSDLKLWGWTWGMSFPPPERNNTQTTTPENRSITHFPLGIRFSIRGSTHRRSVRAWRQTCNIRAWSLGHIAIDSVGGIGRTWGSGLRGLITWLCILWNIVIRSIVSRGVFITVFCGRGWGHGPFRHGWGGYFWIGLMKEWITAKDRESRLGARLMVDWGG